MLENVSGSTVIRRYAAADENAAMDVWSRAGGLAHPFIPGEGEGERARKMREIYLVHAENWVVETDGRVVALLGLLDAEESAASSWPRRHRAPGWAGAWSSTRRRCTAP
ncbi:hypothetical protein SBADM41S_10807 [Streptomyces badius]